VTLKPSLLLERSGNKREGNWIWNEKARNTYRGGWVFT